MSHLQPFDETSTTSGHHPTRKSQAARQARYLYQQASHQNWLRTLWSTLKKRSSRLYYLDEIRESCTVLDHRPLGKQYVQISQIRGSTTEGRCLDFDVNFCPRMSCSEDRWVNVATARKLGKKLPPVNLIKVRDIYFVEDGHHRISVAQVLGEEDIEAGVIEWQVAGSLPWENPSQRSIWTLIKLKERSVV